MYLRFALFLVSATAFAQTMVLTPSAANTCTATSTTLACTGKVGDAIGDFTIYPPATLISVTNSGGGTLTWSAAIGGGTLSTACGGPCIRLLQQYNSTSFTSGTAPSVVKVTPIALGAPFLSVGTYTGTITFTPNVGSPQVITYTLNIVAASGEAETNAPNMGYPVGCPSATMGNTFNDKCTLQTPHMEPPPVCGTYTDPNFGGTVKRITPAGFAVEYGSNTAFSANGTYLVASDISGFIHAFRISDCVDVTGAIGGHGNIAFLTMSALNDQAWYYMTGATLHRYNFITTADTTLGDYAVAPYSFTQIYAGGTMQTSPDDGLSFYEYGAATKLCKVLIPQLITDGSAANTNTWCRDISGDGYSGGIDWAGSMGVDSSTGKYYVWVSAQPWSGLYAVGAAGVLDLVNTAPTWAGFAANDDQEPCNASDAHCVSSQSFTHVALFRDLTGKTQFYNSFQEPNANQVYAAFSALSKTSKAFRMAEEPNGGMYFSQINMFDEQPGSSDAIGGIVTAPFMGSGLAFAAQITSATAANPAVLSVTNALSGPTHTVRVDVKDAGPWKTCLTGYWTATVTGSTLSLAGANCTGAGSFSGQVVIVGDAENAVQSGQSSFLGQVVVIIPGHTVKQVAMHRSVGWSDIGGTGVNYNTSTTKSSLSRDGSMVAWMSYFGTVDPNGTSVYIAGTGLPYSAMGGTRISGPVRITGGTGGTPIH